MHRIVVILLFYFQVSLSIFLDLKKEIEQIARLNQQAEQTLGKIHEDLEQAEPVYQRQVLTINSVFSETEMQFNGIVAQLPQE